MDSIPSDLHRLDKHENRIAESSAAGREALAVWRRVLREMPAERKIMKAFELTEAVNQTMREGVRMRFPEASEEEIQRRWVDQKLAHHGLSIDQLRRQQQQERQEKPA